MTDYEVNSPTQINELTWLLTAQHSTMIPETPNSIVHTVLTLQFCQSKGASEIGFRLRCHSRVALPLDLLLRCALYPPPSVLKWTLGQHLSPVSRVQGQIRVKTFRVFCAVRSETIRRDFCMCDSKVLMQLDRARLGISGGYRDYDGNI